MLKVGTNGKVQVQVVARHIAILKSLKKKDVMKELKWGTGKAGAKLDEPPFRAYFYWMENGQLVQTTDFSESELEAEIARRTAAEEETDPFREALKQLRASSRV